MQLDKRWLALLILCLGDLMIVLDTTIVNVALPSIRADLGFSEASLVWVINAYMLTFSGFLLLGGRLGDLFGQRRMFVLGLAVFTVASLLCGIAGSQAMLIAARALQGLGGAIVAAVALSIVINMFREPGERARAMGFFGFVAAGGGAIGVVLGGLLTGAFDWHWVFLVNIPIGIVVSILCLTLLPKTRGVGDLKHLDFMGAATVTLSLMLAVYAIVGGNEAGWASVQTLSLFCGAIVLFVLFLLIEKRIRNPLVPLSIFKLRSVALVSVMGVMWSAAMFAWFFLSALYLQIILGYTPLQVGLSFLPGNIIMAIFSVWLSAKVVMRFGIKRPLALGMACIALGLLLFSFAPVEGSFLWHVLPGMLLLGFGAGLAFNPVLLAGMSEVKEEESGLASGVLNTAFMMGGALGLAVLASLAAYHTQKLMAQAALPPPVALNEGYHLAFLVGALCAFGAACLVFWLREVDMSKHAAAH